MEPISLTGNVTAQVWVEAAVPTYSTIPFVQRHYQLTPGTNPTVSSATITLYFSQPEFTAFNNHAGSVLDLPTSAGDNSGKANLRITKFNGSSTNTTGLPGSYNLGSSIIDPPDGNIVFNTPLNRWEVTFTTTGFSGFVVQTNATALPVNLVSFKARTVENDVLVNWQTSSETDNDHFDLERSTDGRYFSIVGQLEGNNGNLTKEYSFVDVGAAVLNFPKIFYRLKIVSVFGESEYSKIVVVNSKDRPLFVTSVAPNAFSDRVTINLNLSSKGTVDIMITDIAGRQVYRKGMEMPDGYSSAVVEDLGQLSFGLYLLSVNFDGRLNTYRLVKGN